MDWFALGAPFRSRGVQLSDRDYNSVVQAWMQSYNFLRGIGFSDERAAQLANAGTASAYDDFLAKEHPTPLDKFNADLDAYKKMRGGWSTPQIPILPVFNWLGKKIFKRDIDLTHF